ncbi:MAG: DISARM system SNF2-like helicase DrmD [Polyangiales bacterium]
MGAYEIPAVGMMVRVRSRRHVVEAVAPPRPDRPLERHLVTLACVDDDAAGERAEVLWEAEPDARILTPREASALTVERFDHPARFAAWYHSVRWNSLSVADTGRVQAPFRAGISVESYQFEPLTRALEQPRVRLFIADDVGLGKTIEAALIVREMMLRQRVRRVVVAAPPSVVTQWRDELDARFGLTFVVIDRDYFRARRRERGWHFNPWRTHARFIISHALLRDPHYTTGLRELLRREPAGSMLVLDEAHHAAPSSGARTTSDSAFTRNVRELAPLFEHRVFLSATPHNGHSASFSALMEILDPSRFVRGVKVDPKLRKQVMVRRLKRELRDVGVEFPLREVERVEIRDLTPDDPDLVLPRLLDEYCALREAAAKTVSSEEEMNTFLSLTSLRKRLLSSVFAFSRTLAAHRDGLQRRAASRAAKAAEAEAARPALVPAAMTDAPGADDDRAGDDPDAIEDGALDAVAEASEGSVPLAVTPDAGARLDALLDLARKHAERPDAKVRALVRWIRENLLVDEGTRWGARRLLVFTEYIDTQRYIVRRLREELKGLGRFDARGATLDGQPANDEQRDDVKRRFNADPEVDPLRVLVCTDAAREGINLQARCTDLAHFDLPWNPSRIEQRNGRIDRKGQPGGTVWCRYFKLAQRPEDEVLEALVEKTEVIRKELGSLGEVLVERTEAILREGISRSRAKQQAAAIRQLALPTPGAAAKADPAETAPAETQAEAEPEVVIDAPPSVERSAEEVDDAPQTRAQLQETKEKNDKLRRDAEEAMEFSAESFRRALDVSLSLLGAPPLARDPADEGLWHLAPLDRSPATLAAHADFAGAARIDDSWAETLDGLRIPFGFEPGHDPERHHAADRWGWRRRSRLRPLRFRASATADDASVHMHLEHRVAQRLLGQLSAQGFTRDGVERATVLSIGSGDDRVVLFGRLCIFGNRGARLHDEVLWRAAAWPGAERERTKPLAAYGRTSTDHVSTGKDLQHALANPTDAGVSEFHRRRFLSSVAADVAQLSDALQRLAASRSEAMRERLERLAARQSEALEALLDRQLAFLTKKLADPAQLRFEDRKGFSEADRAAWRSTVRAWEQRRDALQRERITGPAEVRKEYEMRHTHFELLGVVYLTRGE